MNKKKGIKAIIFVCIFVLIDQFTKQLAVNYLKDADSIPIIRGVFSLQYLENRGAAFGLLQNQTIFLAIITILVLALLSYGYVRLPDEKHYRPIQYTLILIASGAIGNFIDRITKHYVVDFFYFELIDFPIFNVADCYVTVSAVLLVLLCIFYYKEEDFECLTKKKENKAL